MLTTFIIIVHVIVCFFLIFIVLIQSGKGAELGAAFGGSSQTLFGARGAATIFSKLTTGAAIVFMLTSLLLAVVTSKGGSVVRQTAPVTSEQKSIPQQGPVSGPVQGTQPLQQGVPAAPPSQSAPPSVPATPSK
jgi:preprotein translocase subunit SecG